VGAPVFIFLFVSPVAAERIASLPFLLLLFLTDILDGLFARRWMVATNFGYILDGVADRSAHIAVVVALVYRHDLSPILGFLLVFREIVLYAARSLFGSWWASNAGFRLHVRVTAVLFKMTAGGIAVVSYMQDLPTPFIAPETRASAQSVFCMATWLFAIWSYVLLALQIRRYAIYDDTSDRRGIAP